MPDAFSVGAFLGFIFWTACLKLFFIMSQIIRFKPYKKVNASFLIENDYHLIVL